MSSLTLYPSNWLYNAGVIGLLRVIESAGVDVGPLFKDGTIKDDIKSLKSMLSTTSTDLESPLNKLPNWHWFYTKKSFEWNYGSIGKLVTDILMRAEYSTNKSQLKEQLKCKNFKYKINKNKTEEIDFECSINKEIDDIWNKIFGRNPQYTINEAVAELVKSIKKKECAYIYRKAVGYLFSKGGFYQNLYNPSRFGNLNDFIDLFKSSEVFKERDSSSTSVCGFCAESKFEVEPVDAKQMSFLFPVFSKFPNAYWQNNEKAVTQICSLCKFLIIHHHLSLTRLSDGSEIFINAPSFQVMWYLNKFTQEVFGSVSSEEMRSRRTLLAMSVIEYATKIQATLGVWTGMNIEVVSRRGGAIEFFSLPYEVVQLLADRRIASLLSQIGEFEIMNRVLDQDFSRLMEMGYRLLRIGLRSYNDRAKSENDFVNWTLRLEKNRRNPASVAEQIFKLCAFIEEKRKRRAEYERIRFVRT